MEEKSGNRILITLVSTSSSNGESTPKIYPSPSHHDIREDEGDFHHAKRFIFLSDDEGTKFRKERRSEFMLRKRERIKEANQRKV